MREQVRVKQDIALAWRSANFFAAAQCGKLKDLKHYLEETEGDRPQTAEEVLAIFQGFEGRGVTIREIPKNEVN